MQMRAKGENQLGKYAINLDSLLALLNCARLTAPQRHEGD